eukprot:g6601.t1
MAYAFSEVQACWTWSSAYPSASALSFLEQLSAQHRTFKQNTQGKEYCVTRTSSHGLATYGGPRYDRELPALPLNKHHLGPLCRRFVLSNLWLFFAGAIGNYRDMYCCMKNNGNPALVWSGFWMFFVAMAAQGHQYYASYSYVSKESKVSRSVKQPDVTASQERSAAHVLRNHALRMSALFYLAWLPMIVGGLVTWAHGGVVTDQGEAFAKKWDVLIVLCVKILPFLDCRVILRSLERAEAYRNMTKYAKRRSVVVYTSDQMQRFKHAKPATEKCSHCRKSSVESATTNSVEITTTGRDIANAGRDSRHCRKNSVESATTNSVEIATTGRDIANAGRDKAAANAGRDIANAGRDKANAGRDIANPAGRDIANAGLYRSYTVDSHSSSLLASSLSIGQLGDSEKEQNFQIQDVTYEERERNDTTGLRRAIGDRDESKRTSTTATTPTTSTSTSPTVEQTSTSATTPDIADCQQATCAVSPPVQTAAVPAKQTASHSSSRHQHQPSPLFSSTGKIPQESARTTGSLPKVGARVVVRITTTPQLQATRQLRIDRASRGAVSNQVGRQRSLVMSEHCRVRALEKKEKDPLKEHNRGSSWLYPRASLRGGSPRSISSFLDERHILLGKELSQNAKGFPSKTYLTPKVPSSSIDSSISSLLAVGEDHYDHPQRYERTPLISD